MSPPEHGFDWSVFTSQDGGDLETIDLTRSSPEPETRILRTPHGKSRVHHSTPKPIASSSRTSGKATHSVHKPINGSIAKTPSRSASATGTMHDKITSKTINPRHLSKIVYSAPSAALRGVILELCEMSPALAAAVARGLAPTSSYARKAIEKHSKRFADEYLGAVGLQPPQVESSSQGRRRKSGEASLSQSASTVRPELRGGADQQQFGVNREQSARSRSHGQQPPLSQQHSRQTVSVEVPSRRPSRGDRGVVSQQGSLRSPERQYAYHRRFGSSSEEPPIDEAATVAYPALREPRFQHAQSRERPTDLIHYESMEEDAASEGDEIAEDMNQSTDAETQNEDSEDEQSHDPDGSSSEPGSHYYRNVAF